MSCDVASMETAMLALEIACNHGAESSEIVEVLTCISNFPLRSLDLCRRKFQEIFSRYVIPLLKSPFKNVHQVLMKLIRGLVNCHSSLITLLLSNEFIEVLIEKCTTSSDQIGVMLACVAELLENYDSARLPNTKLLEFCCNIVTDQEVKLNIRQVAARVLSLGMSPEISPEAKTHVLHAIQSILNQPEFMENLWTDLAFIPSKFIVDLESSRVVLFEFNFLEFFCNVMCNATPTVLKTAAIEAVGRYFLYQDSPINFPYNILVECIVSEDCDLAAMAMWMVSNAIASSAQMVDFLEEHGLFPALAKIKSEGTAAVRIECYVTIAQIVCHGNPRHVAWCIENSCMEAFMELIESEEEKWIIYGLRGISKLLKFEVKELREAARCAFAGIGGPERIAELTTSSIEAVADAASLFMDKYS